MNKLSISELVLNSDGDLYHIKLSPEKLAQDVILVGDPKRVEIVSGFFDRIEYKVHNREIHTHTGYYKGKRITVMSTGMGTDNIDIVLTELDACINIDLKNKTLKKEKKILNIIRIGTSGSMQADILCGGYVASEYALGLDGMIYFYRSNPGVLIHEAKDRFIEFMDWDKTLPYPYMVKASENILNKIAFDMTRGITATAPGFYAPQGREIRIPLSFPEINNKISQFTYDNLKVTNYEMESSALYAMGKNLGHNILTVCLIIANRKRGDILSDYNSKMKDLVKLILERILE